MTLRERAENVFEEMETPFSDCMMSWDKDADIAIIENAIAAAVAAERERCAKIAGDHAKHMDECVTILRENGNPATHHKAAWESVLHIERMIRRGE
jgi:hypothetical protein